MGTEYYVIDRLNKTFYDLGKGGWYALQNDTEAFQDQEYLVHYILEECYHRDITEDERWNEIVNYVNSRVAPDLFNAFGKTPKSDLFIAADVCDDITICKAKRYRCVGIRYYEIGDEKWCNAMQYQNRHLSDDIMNKRWWNPELYVKYPEWERY